MLNNILVVGGAGYIGVHIVDLLCDMGHKVIVLDNLYSGYKENINKKADFILGDITNKSLLKSVFENNKIDSVIHMAALKAVADSNKDTRNYTENNVIGSINLISSCIDFNVKKFIFSSTAAVYGNPKYNPIDENHTSLPINHYGYTKLLVENYLSWISNIEEINFVSLRYFNAAGYSKKTNLIKYKEKAPENLLPIIMEVANGDRDNFSIFGSDYNTSDGTCIRDYIHVLDLAIAHMKALDYLENNKINQIINLSTGVGSSVLDVVKTAENCTNRKINYLFKGRRAGDPDSLISKTQKAKEILNWEAKYSLIDIVESMWSIYKKAPK